MTKKMAQKAIKKTKKIVKKSFKTTYIINQLERLVKTHLKLLKICLTIQTNWPKVPYDSKKSYLLLQHQNTYVTTLLSCCIKKSIQKHTKDREKLA